MNDAGAAVSFGDSALDYDRVRPVVAPGSLEWLRAGRGRPGDGTGIHRPQGRDEGDVPSETGRL